MLAPRCGSRGDNGRETVPNDVQAAGPPRVATSLVSRLHESNLTRTPTSRSVACVQSSAVDATSAFGSEPQLAEKSAQPRAWLGRLQFTQFGGALCELRALSLDTASVLAKSLHLFVDASLVLANRPLLLPNALLLLAYQGCLLADVLFLLI